jgi:hypothetical protein
VGFVFYHLSGGRSLYVRTGSAAGTKEFPQRCSCSYRAICNQRLTWLFALAESSAEPATKVRKGFRSLFDGVSLSGWSRQIREAAMPGLGIWTAQQGMIVGGQNRPTIGSYLVTDGTFSDFEIELEARPDWKTDTGVYVRTNAQGNVGFQACIDYRPHGAIGSYYGDGIGGFHACDYCFTGKVDKDGHLVELVPEKPSEPLDATHHVPLDYSVPRCTVRTQLELSWLEPFSYSFRGCGSHSYNLD